MPSLSDPYLATRYAALRRRGGMVSIAYNLFLVWALWIWTASQRHNLPSPDLASAAAVSLIFWGVLHLLNLPLDFLWGYVFEKKWQRFEGSAWSWCQQWIAGSAVLFLLQTLGTFLVLLWMLGPGWGVSSALLLPAGYVFLRVFQPRWIPASLLKSGGWPPDYLQQFRHELRRLQCEDPGIELYQSEDGHTLSGGRVGIGRWSRFLVSDCAVQHLTPRELALLVVREDEILGSSYELKHFVIGYGWYILGLYLAVGSSALWVYPAWENLAWVVAFMSTWSFASLFLFPAISRRDVLRADAALARWPGVSRDEVVALIEKLQAINGTEARRNSLREMIFHPIPSLQTRLENLQRVSPDPSNSNSTRKKKRRS